MAIEGVDYSDARPSPAGLWAAGKRFVVRYGGPGGSSKHLGAGELRGLLAAGLSVVANAEGSSGGLAGGRPAGRAWAASADAAFRALGMPPDRPIYLSVDWDVTSSQWPAVAEALRGAADAIGAARVGVYGGIKAITWAKRDRVAAWFWQTYAWSGGAWLPWTHLQQYRNGVTVAGGDCDLNRAMAADFGQWGQPAPTPPQPRVALVSPPMGADMIYQVTGVPAGAKDITGAVIPENGQCTATPGGPFNYTGGEFFSLPADAQAVHMKMTYARLMLLCAGMAKANVDVAGIVSGVLTGLADDPASDVTQADVDRVIAAIEATPAAVREEFTTDPLA